jgi:pimeloyl-ACP methyl ester carboxylesterase
VDSNSTTVAPTRRVPSELTVRSADGVELAVMEQGDRSLPGILFLHGFGQSKLSFRRQFGSDLADRYHLVAFDLRGHGASAKPNDPAAYSDPRRSSDDVAAVMRATGLTRPVMVAWSYGGIVAGDYLRRFEASDLAGLVLVGTLGGFTKEKDPLPSTLADVASRMRSASDQTRSLDLAANIAGARTISDAYANVASKAEDRQILFATELMLPAYVRRAMVARPSDNTDLVGKLAGLPILLIRGETELGMPEAGIAELKRQLPQLTISRYPGGHLTFFDAADRFNRELADFVDRSQPAPRAAAKPAGLPLSRAGHRAFRDREFAMMDRNGDGLIDHAELRLRMEAAVGRSSPEALARAMRVNCGRDVPACSRAAFRHQGDAEFTRLDANNDGIVSQEEFVAAGSTFHREKPF